MLSRNHIDFTNIRIPDEKKVRVTFYEAKNADQKAFTSSRADTYKAVYYAEPANTDHPAYRFNRNIVVKEKAVQKSVAAEKSVAASAKASSSREACGYGILL